MNVFGNLALGFAAVVYLVSSQLALHRPVSTNHGEAIATLVMALLSSVLFWGALLASWCVLFARDDLFWISNSRVVQFFAMLIGCLALAGVVTLSFGLRGDTRLPWGIKPLMPWAVYVIPPLLLAATASLLNPGLSARLHLLTTGRATLTVLSGSAMALAITVATYYAVLRTREKQRTAYQSPAGRQKIFERTMREITSAKPEQDLVFLLNCAGQDRLEAAREAALQKIDQHPDLYPALTQLLAGSEAEAVFRYLKFNTPAQMVLLTEPVRAAIRRRTAEIKREIEDSESLDCYSFVSEITVILEVADKLQKTGANCGAEISGLREAFDSPKAKNVTENAIHQLDQWLLKHRPRPAASAAGTDALVSVSSN